MTVVASKMEQVQGVVSEFERSRVIVSSEGGSDGGGAMLVWHSTMHAMRARDLYMEVRVMRDVRLLVDPARSAVLLPDGRNDVDDDVDMDEALLSQLGLQRDAATVASSHSVGDAEDTFCVTALEVSAWRRASVALGVTASGRIRATVVTSAQE